MGGLNANLISLQTPLRQLLSMGSLASLGAPSVFMLLVLFETIGSSDLLSLAGVGSAFLVALFFSWVGSMALVLVTCLIAMLMKRRTINVAVVSILHLTGIFFATWLNSDVMTSLILVGFSLSNALVFMFVASKWSKKSVS
jgi:hypothetical protein